MADGGKAMLQQNTHLRMSGEEDSISGEEAANIFEDQPSRLGSQIDENVSAEDDVVGRLPGEKTGVHQIFAVKMNGPDDGL